MIILGIDPGKKGGVSISCGGGVVGAFRMPKTPIELVELLNKMIYAAMIEEPNSAVKAYIENVHAMPGQGVTSMFSFGRGFGEILGVCAALDICVELVSPQRWKRAVLSGTAKDKAAAIGFVQREYPNIDLVPERCRVPHDGIADAVCIGRYGMTMEANK